jgi:hypothetical protein
VLAIAARKSGSACAVVKRTVVASTASIASVESMNRFSTLSAGPRPSSKNRVNDALTAAASQVVPSWNWTFGLILKVKTVLSGLASHDSASIGSYSDVLSPLYLISMS